MQESPAEAERNSLSAISRAELAEQPTGMGLDGVFGQEELFADARV